MHCAGPVRDACCHLANTIEDIFKISFAHERYRLLPYYFGPCFDNSQSRDKPANQPTNKFQNFTRSCAMRRFMQISRVRRVARSESHTRDIRTRSSSRSSARWRTSLVRSAGRSPRVYTSPSDRSKSGSRTAGWRARSWTRDPSSWCCREPLRRPVRPKTSRYHRLRRPQPLSVLRLPTIGVGCFPGRVWRHRRRGIPGDTRWRHASRCSPIISSLSSNSSSSSSNCVAVTSRLTSW